jgi:transcriptional regulator NrdR family protein
MKCPVCQSDTKCINSREAKGLHYTTHRKYECMDCLTRFKTSEKILFGSLPAYLRERFLGTGRRKEW